MKKLLAVMRRPLFFVVINFFLVNTLFSLLPHHIGDIVYNLGRIAIIVYAGWLVTASKAGGRWHAALAGIIVYFVDHVVIKGGIFLLNYIFKPDGAGLAAFGGVVASFVMLIPLSMLFGMLGGIAALSRRKRSPVGEP